MSSDNYEMLMDVAGTLADEMHEAIFNALQESVKAVAFKLVSADIQEHQFMDVIDYPVRILATTYKMLNLDSAILPDHRLFNVQVQYLQADKVMRHRICFDHEYELGFHLDKDAVAAVARNFLQDSSVDPLSWTYVPGSKPRYAFQRWGIEYVMYVEENQDMFFDPLDRRNV